MIFVIREIWDNFEISRVVYILVLVPNNTYKSCYHLFILLLTKGFVIFMITCRYFELSWNTTALSQSNCRNFSCSGIKLSISYAKLNDSKLNVSQANEFRKLIKDWAATKAVEKNWSFLCSGFESLNCQN